MAIGVLYWQKRRKSQPTMQGYTVFDGTLRLRLFVQLEKLLAQAARPRL